MKESAITIRRKLIGSTIFLIVTFLFSFITLIFPETALKNDPPETWFQRSGSFIVVASIWTEFILIRTQGYLDPYDEAYIAITDMPQSLNTLHRYLSSAAIGLALYGTLVWGYGDIFIKNT